MNQNKQILIYLCTAGSIIKQFYLVERAKPEHAEFKMLNLISPDDLE